MRTPGLSTPSVADLSRLLRDLAARFENRPAVVDESSELSFRALDASAERWAAAFAAAGYGPGAHVGLLDGNGAEWLSVAFGVWRAGATLVPVSTFVTRRELEETLVHADVDVLVLRPQLRSHAYLSLLPERAAAPRLQTVVVLAAEAILPHRCAIDFLAASGPPRPATLDPESIACILYTSGTTGRAKGVMLSHRAVLATVFPTVARSGLTSEDTMLSSLPLFWVAGLVIRALPTLAAGSSLIMTPTFSTDAVVSLLRQHRPTAIHLRPAQVGQVLAHPEFEPALLANVRRGNGRVEWYAPLELPDARFITGYGMTEMAGYVMCLDWQDTEDLRRSELGAPLPGVEIRIVGAADPTGIGHILLRGPGMFSGYYNEPPGTGLDAEGFFVTGDLGRIDSAGVLHFVGRSKDLLRVKGINVSPVEVEDVLRSHPAVEAAYVVGLPPGALEQQLVALVVCRLGARADEDALRTLARDALSHYKRPAAYLFVSRDDVPLSATAKPQRSALAELAAARLAGR